jgi:ArsR family transcriptional regulator
MDTAQPSAQESREALPETLPTPLTAAQFVKIARALAEPRRVRILKQLGESETATPCSEVTLNGEVSAPTVSHHLKELQNAGLLEITRQGKFAYLKLNRAMLDAYLGLLHQI